MDKTSYKNILQELCAQKNIPLPIYTTVIAGGAGHSPIFKTILQVADKEYTISAGGTRKEVENKCAQLAAADIRTVVRHSPKPSPSPLTLLTTPASLPPTLSLAHRPSSTVIVLVDLDNCDIPLSLIQSSQAQFHIFVSKNSPKNFTQYRQIDNCVVYVAPTTVRDAADTQMVYEARSLRDRYPTAYFIIFTRDHFGETLSILTRGTYICYIKELEETIVAASQ